jgi:hypothetical protein
MPEISRFFGMIITMVWNDHPPPHFHVRYGDHEASVRIDPPTLMAGRLPARALGLVIEWATLHRQELLDEWQRARAHIPLLPVAPLE